MASFVVHLQRALAVGLHVCFTVKNILFCKKTCKHIYNTIFGLAIFFSEKRNLGLPLCEFCVTKPGFERSGCRFFLQQNGSVFFLFPFFRGKGSYLSEEQLKYWLENARNQWQIPLTSIPFDFLRFESNFELLCLGSQKRHHFGFTVDH